MSTFARSFTIDGDRAGSGRSIDGAYLLDGMRARKWRAGKNAGPRVNSEDKKEPGRGSTWRTSYTGVTRRFCPVDENSPFGFPSFFAFEEVIGKKDDGMKERAIISD